MKDIETILSEAGITVTDEQKKTVLAAVEKNYKALNEYESQGEKLKAAEEKNTMLAEQMKEFEGIDSDELKRKIEQLEKDIETKDREFAEKMAERDFNDLLRQKITSAQGRNIKAIIGCLDVDTLRNSKNQEKDIEAALKELSEAEDGKMLFGEAVPVRKTGIIGSVERNGGSSEDDSQMRAVMGLPASKAE